MYVKLIGFELNGVDYYYVKNQQDDIIGILDNTGACVVEYTYDAWGKLLTTTGSLASTVGVLNPFRYRSYYYDTETGLFYVGSRYYDPVTSRMLNADDTGILQATQGQLLGANLYAYCGNNPVMGSDQNGYYDWYYISNTTINKIIGALTIAASGLGFAGIITSFVPPPAGQFLVAFLGTLAFFAGVAAGVLQYINADGKGIKIRISTSWFGIRYISGVFSQ